jgi:hypothetical protein
MVAIKMTSGIAAMIVGMAARAGTTIFLLIRDGTPKGRVASIRRARWIGYLEVARVLERADVGREISIIVGVVVGSGLCRGNVGSKDADGWL